MTGPSRPSRQAWACWLALGALLSWTRPAGAQERLLKGPEPFPLLAPPTALLVEDLDGDGWTDLAVAHRSRTVVSVLLNEEETVFAEPDLYEAGLGPSFLSSFDFDADGRRDLFVLNRVSSSASILRNLGRGTFEKVCDVEVVPDALAAALDDFDGDGVPDAAVFSERSSVGVQILLGNRPCGLVESSRLAVAGRVLSVRAEDVDGDGKLDLLVLHHDPSGATGLTRTWFRGAGAGSFDLLSARAIELVSAPRIALPIESVGDFPRVGVLTEDGDVLLVRTSPDGMVEVAEVDHAGEDEAFVPFLDALDFDGDGRADLVALVDVSGVATLRIYAGRTDGSFSRSDDIPIGTSGVTSMAFADVDRDGVLDALVARETSRTLALVRGGGQRQLEAPHFVTPGWTATDLLTVDGGGVLARNGRELSFVRSDGQGGFEDIANPELPEVQTLLGPAGYIEMVRLDLDGDGNDDVGLSASSSLPNGLGGREGAVVVARGDGAGLFRIAEVFSIPTPGDIAAADLDHDSFDDVVVADRSTASLTVLFNTARGLAAGPRIDVAGLATDLQAADLDDDGLVDLVVASSAGLELRYGDGAGEFPRRRIIQALWSTPRMQIADVDRDGRLDLVGIDFQRIVILRAFVEDGIPEREHVDFSGVGIRTFALGDLGGSEHLELVAIHGPPDLTTVVRGGANGFSLRETYHVGVAPHALALGDLDGDDRLECIVSDRASGAIVVLDSTAERGAVKEEFRRGDANQDASVNLADAVSVLESLFAGRGTLDCPDAGDADDDGSIRLTDGVVILAYLFANGPAPRAPGPAMCGEDPTEDGLATCEGACR